MNLLLLLLLAIGAFALCQESEKRNIYGAARAPVGGKSETVDADSESDEEVGDEDAEHIPEGAAITEESRR